MMAFAVASCGGSASSDLDENRSERYLWEKLRQSDSAGLAKAKRACAQYKVVPMPGGTDPFTKCMKEQADAAFGTPTFDEICGAIPGSKPSQSERKCMTFDL